ncbi:FMN-linked oxidoreductase [Phellopilus nigrolimitatus]|nr:FMN-linked oxidoreductase [Phellopilus nigrolimitatus]
MLVPPSGTALSPQPDGKPIPRVFQPIKIRGVEFHNRIFYSAEEGRMSPWHMAHLGGIFTRGPGLTIIEATAVVPEGRITPEDAGLWSDDQIPPMRDIVEFAHSQGVKIGIQLAHAGRKASTVAPWLDFGATAATEHGGWPDDVWAPSAVPYNESLPKPKELTREGIKRVVREFAEASRRALKAGLDVIEIHNAHGYLLHSFLSPVSNKRTDEYDGSFENRVRLTLEIVDAESLPNEPSWTLADTIKLSGILAAHGVDLLDVTCAGLHPAQRIVAGTAAGLAFQAHFTEAIRNEHGIDTPTKLFVGAVGELNTGPIAEEVLQRGMADVTLVARQFQKDPSNVLTFAEQLCVRIKVAHQIGWGLGLGTSGRGRRRGLEGKDE